MRSRDERAGARTPGQPRWYRGSRLPSLGVNPRRGRLPLLCSAPNGRCTDMSITDQLVSLRDEGLAAVAAASDLASLDAVRVDYLGKKGSLTASFEAWGRCPPRSARPRARSPTRSASRSRPHSQSASRCSRPRARGADRRGGSRRDAAGPRDAPSAAAISSSRSPRRSSTSSSAWATRSPRGPRSSSTTTTSPRSTRRRTTRRAAWPTRSTCATFPARSRRIAGRKRRSAAHADEPGAGARHGEPEAADLRARAGQGLPPRHRRPEPPAAIHADRGPCRRRGHHVRRPQGHAGPRLQGDLRPRRARVSARTSSRSPSRPPRST